MGALFRIKNTYDITFPATSYRPWQVYNVIAQVLLAYHLPMSPFGTLPSCILAKMTIRHSPPWLDDDAYRTRLLVQHMAGNLLATSEILIPPLTIFVPTSPHKIPPGYYVIHPQLGKEVEGLDGHCYPVVWRHQTQLTSYQFHLQQGTDYTDPNKQKTWMVVLKSHSKKRQRTEYDMGISLATLMKCGPQDRVTLHALHSISREETFNINVEISLLGPEDVSSPELPSKLLSVQRAELQQDKEEDAASEVSELTDIDMDDIVEPEEDEVPSRALDSVFTQDDELHTRQAKDASFLLEYSQFLQSHGLRAPYSLAIPDVYDISEAPPALFSTSSERDDSDILLQRDRGLQEVPQLPGLRTTPLDLPLDNEQDEGSAGLG